MLPLPGRVKIEFGERHHLLAVATITALSPEPMKLLRLLPALFLKNPGIRTVQPFVRVRVRGQLHIDDGRTIFFSAVIVIEQSSPLLLSPPLRNDSSFVHHHQFFQCRRNYGQPRHNGGVHT